MAAGKKTEAAEPTHARIGCPHHLSVCAKQAGFRRAGRAWPAEEVIVETDKFSDEELKQLMSEPMLVVLPIADDQ